MKKITLLFGLLLLMGCAPTMDFTWAKDSYLARKFNKIAVVVVSKDQSIRSEVENRVVADLRKNGINAIASINSFLPVNASKSDWETETIAKKLKQIDCDGAIGISLVNTRDRKDYVPGQSYLYPVGYYRYGRHVYTNYNRVYTPGYYEQSKEYIIEANLYDLTVSTKEEEAMVWKGHSSITNPNSIESGVNSYADNLIKYMIQNNVLLGTTK